MADRPLRQLGEDRRLQRYPVLTAFQLTRHDVRVHVGGRSDQSCPTLLRHWRRGRDRCGLRVEVVMPGPVEATEGGDLLDTSRRPDTVRGDIGHRSARGQVEGVAWTDTRTGLGDGA